MSPEETLAFLLARGLLTAREIVDGGLRLEEVPARNVSYRVIAPGGRGYFVKSAPRDDEASAQAIRLEADVYAVANDPAAPLRPYVATLELADRGSAVLVFELLAGKTVYDCEDGDTALGLPRVAPDIATALAACHAMPLSQTDPAGALTLGTSPPWALNLARPRVELLQDCSMAQVELLRLLQRTAIVGDGLDRLRTEWTATHLIHGDFKWGNILVDVRPDTGRSRGIKLVDWETAAVGDPMWDVGAVLHAYLSHITHVIALDEDATADTAASDFAARLPHAQHEMRAFVDAYVARTRNAPDSVDSLLDRAVRVCGARLVQSAWEWCAGEHAIPRAGAGMLQLAVNIFSRPGDARRLLLGNA
jgi:aminoglycoside phosphotransferase (APT) family kinase protein